VERENDQALKKRLLAEHELQKKIASAIRTSTMTHKSGRVLDQFEFKVLERELIAAESLAKIKIANEEMKLEPIHASQAIDVVEDKASSIRAAFDSLGQMIDSLDPSVEKAYRRLESQIAASNKSAELSEEVERNLELSIERLKDSSVTWQNRAKTYELDPENPILANVMSRKLSVDESAAELSNALVAHKTKNLANAQVLFRVEGIARRLHFLKLMISALPETSKDDLSSLTQFIDAICSYLQNTLQDNASENGELKGAAFLSERIYLLEQNLLMKYIEFAKVKLKNLNSVGASKFAADSAAISSALGLERESSKSELLRWETVLKQAIEDNMQLLQSVAEQRIEHYSGVIRMTDQTIEVLSVISMAATC